MSEKTVNFMNGVSFKVSPLKTLQIVLTSMICGEPQFYRQKDASSSRSDVYRQKRRGFRRGRHSRSTLQFDNSQNDSSRECRVNDYAKNYSQYFILEDIYKDKEDVRTYIEKLIDNALNDNFQATIEFIPTLRKEYFMRLNPQVLLVRALAHKDIATFNKTHPNLMRSIIDEAGQLPTDWCKQYELLQARNIYFICS